MPSCRLKSDHNSPSISDYIHYREIKEAEYDTNPDKDHNYVSLKSISYYVSSHCKIWGKQEYHQGTILCLKSLSHFFAQRWSAT